MNTVILLDSFWDVVVSFWILLELIFMTKIAIIGPSYPWRGGIAHHTGSLAYNFGKAGLETEIFNFCYLYPSFLYPGKFQRELGENPYLELKSNYFLNPLNPFTWYRVYKKIYNDHFSVCIFKYWHFYFAPCYIFIAFLLRRKNIKTVCIIDNIFTHEGSIFDKIFAKSFFNFIDISITQSAIVDKEFSELLNNKKHIMLPHPVYNHFGAPVPQLEARKNLYLPLNKKIFLFFGFIRPYKGLDIFLNSMPEIIKIIPDCHLVIAGECFGPFDNYEKIIFNKNLEKFTTCHIKYIENSQIPLYFSAADALIMPYRTATNSGVMEIANFYGLPIIASKIPAFEKYKNSVASRLQLINFTNLADLKKIFFYKEKQKSSYFSWDEYVDLIKKVL